LVEVIHGFGIILSGDGVLPTYKEQNISSQPDTLGITRLTII